MFLLILVFVLVLEIPAKIEDEDEEEGLDGTCADANGARRRKFPPLDKPP